MSRVVQSIDDFSDDEFDDFDDADLCALDEAEKAYLAAKASERQQQLLHQNPHPLPQPQQHQEPNEEKRKFGQRHYQEPQQNKGRNMQSGRHQHGRSDTLSESKNALPPPSGILNASAAAKRQREVQASHLQKVLGCRPYGSDKWHCAECTFLNNRPLAPDQAKCLACKARAPWRPKPAPPSAWQIGYSKKMQSSSRGSAASTVRVAPSLSLCGPSSQRPSNRSGGKMMAVGLAGTLVARTPAVQRCAPNVVRDIGQGNASINKIRVFDGPSELLRLRSPEARALFPRAEGGKGNANSTGTRLGQPCPPPRTLAHHSNSRRMAGPSLDAKPPVMLDELAAMSYHYPSHYDVREYQLAIVQEALFRNTLVMLPTGLGKTLIAAVLMLNFYRWFPDGKIIFMAPTKPLVEQQVQACHKVVGIPCSDTAELQGKVKPSDRRVFWRERRVFFCTPQTLANDLKNGVMEAPEKVVLMVIDEAHKATGNYAYTVAVRFVRTKTAHFRVLALSATPGKDLDKVQEVVDNLIIEHLEVRSETDPDVKQYTHRKMMEVRVVKMPPILDKVKAKFNNMMQKPVNALVSARVIYERDPKRINGHTIVTARNAFEKRQRQQGSGSRCWSPVLGQLGLMTTLVHTRKLLANHGFVSFYEKMKSLRDEVTAGCANSFKRQLVNLYEFKDLMAFLAELERSGDIVHPKLQATSKILRGHFSRAQEAERQTRAIVFTQYRSSVKEIVNVLQRECSPLVRAVEFVGQGSAAGRVRVATNSAKRKGKKHEGKSALRQGFPKFDDLKHLPKDKAAISKADTEAAAYITSEKARRRALKGQTQKEQKLAVKKFRKGIYNVLVATCIGEEGLDIGAVDLIINFDALTSPVRMVQRMGRTGRHRTGRVVVLVTEGAEAQKQKQSEQNAKKLAKFMRNGARHFKFHVSPRMIPGSIEPVMEKKELNKEEFRDSQVGGHGQVRTRRKCRANLTESQESFVRDYIASQNNGDRTRNCSRSAFKSVMGTILAEEKWRALAADQTKGCHMAHHVQHSVGALILAKMVRFVQDEEWEESYPESALKLWAEDVARRQAMETKKPREIEARILAKKQKRKELLMKASRPMWSWMATKSPSASGRGTWDCRSCTLCGNTREFCDACRAQRPVISMEAKKMPACSKSKSSGSVTKIPDASSNGGINIDDEQIMDLNDAFDACVAANFEAPIDTDDSGIGDNDLLCFHPMDSVSRKCRRRPLLDDASKVKCVSSERETFERSDLQLKPPPRSKVTDLIDSDNEKRTEQAQILNSKVETFAQPSSFGVLHDQGGSNGASLPLLPEGWCSRELSRKSDALHRQYISPEGQIFRSLKEVSEEISRRTSTNPHINKHRNINVTAENKLDCRNAERKRSSSQRLAGVSKRQKQDVSCSDPPGPGLSASLIASTVAASASEAALEAAKQLRHLLPECERAGHKLGCVLDLGHVGPCVCPSVWSGIISVPKIASSAISPTKDRIDLSAQDTMISIFGSEKSCVREHGVDNPNAVPDIACCLLQGSRASKSDQKDEENDQEDSTHNLGNIFVEEYQKFRTISNTTNCNTFHSTLSENAMFANDENDCENGMSFQPDTTNSEDPENSAVQPSESVSSSSSAMQPSSMVSGKVQKFTVVFPRATLGMKLRKKSLSVTAFTSKFPWNDEPEKGGIRYDDQVLEINGVAVQTREKMRCILKNGVPPFEILFSRRVARKSHVSNVEVCICDTPLNVRSKDSSEGSAVQSAKMHVGSEDWSQSPILDSASKCFQRSQNQMESNTHFHSISNSQSQTESHAKSQSQPLRKSSKSPLLPSQLSRKKAKTKNSSPRCPPFRVVHFPSNTLGLKLNKELFVTAFTSKFEWYEREDKGGVCIGDRVHSINQICVDSKENLRKVLADSVPPVCVSLLAASSPKGLSSQKQQVGVKMSPLQSIPRVCCESNSKPVARDREEVGHCNHTGADKINKRGISDHSKLKMPLRAAEDATDAPGGMIDRSQLKRREFSTAEERSSDRRKRVRCSSVDENETRFEKSNEIKPRHSVENASSGRTDNLDNTSFVDDVVLLSQDLSEMEVSISSNSISVSQAMGISQSQTSSPPTRLRRLRKGGTKRSNLVNGGTLQKENEAIRQRCVKNGISPHERKRIQRQAVRFMLIDQAGVDDENYLDEGEESMSSNKDLDRDLSGFIDDSTPIKISTSCFTSSQVSSREDVSINMYRQGLVDESRDFGEGLGRNLERHFREGGVLQQVLRNMKSDTEHVGYACDGCNMNPIRGVRIHCDSCRNVDFCSVCAADPDHFAPHSGHRVVEFKDALKPSQETSTSISSQESQPPIVLGLRGTNHENSSVQMSVRHVSKGEKQISGKFMAESKFPKLGPIKCKTIHRRETCSQEVVRHFKQPRSVTERNRRRALERLQHRDTDKKAEKQQRRRRRALSNPTQESCE